MTLVSGPLSTVTTTPSAVAQVNISIDSPRTRGAGVMTPEVKTVTVTGGAFSSQIAPGPAVLTLLIGGRESVPIPILVDDVASQTLAEVVDAARLATGQTQESLAQFVQQVLTAKNTALTEIDESVQTTIDTVAIPAIEGARDEALGQVAGAVNTAIGTTTSYISRTDNLAANQIVRLNNNGKLSISTASITGLSDPVNKHYADAVVGTTTSYMAYTDTRFANQIVRLNASGKLHITTAAITGLNDPANKQYVDATATAAADALEAKIGSRLAWWN